MSGSMQGLFLRAHTVLHPEGAAMKDLIASGVSERRIMSLYPYELRDWLPALIIEEQQRSGKPEVRPNPEGVMYWRTVGVGDQELHARMRGIEEGARQLPLRGWARWIEDQTDRCLETLSTPEGANWLAAMGFVYASGNDLFPLASTISVLDELIAMGSRWPDFPDLHQHDEQWRPLVEASLACLLPSEFPIDYPPVRYDTMGFR